MSEPKLYPVHDRLKGKTFFTAKEYRRLYDESIENPEAFWAKEARRLDWIRPFTKVKDTSYHRENFHIRWYEDETLNACYSCIDRHLPHDIKGQGIHAFVTLHKKETPIESLKKELIDLVRKKISTIASPDVIQWAPGLPKTRSGKIMRRILRKIAANELETLGDISTLADPLVVEDLIKNRLSA